MVRSFLFGLASISLVSAHIQLLYPPGFETDEDSQPEGPCGGATIAVDDNSPEVQVDQFPLSIYTAHPTGSFSLFASTSMSEPYNWTQLTPGVVNTTGSGDFCLTHMSIPSDWAGKKGILQVIDAGPDGVLHQCSPVRFVKGANTTVGASCSNSTGFTAKVSTESSNTSNPSSTTGSSSAATSQGAAALTGVFGSVLGLGLLAAGLAF